MGTALYIQASNGNNTYCPYHPEQAICWTDDLPPTLKDLVVAPVRFDVFQEYEMQADRTCGRDAANQPCYCAFRLVQTQLRSDDDEVYYETPVYAESLTCWRLLDERWLVYRTTVGSFDLADVKISLSLSDAMPR